MIGQQMSGHPSMTAPRDAGVAVLKFWTVQNFNESTKEFDGIDWVEYSPKGRAGMSTQEKVERLRKTNPAVWPQIERHYEHWKKGQDMPTDGTPLEAWPGIAPGQISRLKDLHVRTVEDLATLTDAALDKIGMGARELQRRAQAFVNNIDGAAVAARQAKLEAENDALRVQLAELADAVKQMKADDKKPRRGKAAAAEDDE
jgi:hypothetical protein